MQIFFIVEDLKNIEEKINLFQTYFDAEFKFFVDLSLYPKIASNPFIIQQLAGVYEGYPSKKINEYIKSEKYSAQDVIIYYSSMQLSAEMLKQIKDKLPYQYNTIRVKHKFNTFRRMFNWVYDKIIKFIFGLKDSLSTTKLQYMNKAFMQELVDSKFNNRIFEVERSSVIECEDKNIVSSMKSNFKLKKYNIYNFIFLASTVVAYTVCEIFLKLRFWAYILFIFFMLLSVLLSFLLISNNIFEVRYENPKPNYLTDEPRTKVK